MPANNDSSLVQEWHEQGTTRKAVLTVTFDSGDGSFAATALTKGHMDGHILRVQTNPGTVAPTDQYDITLVDDGAVDVLQGLCANRHTTNTETVNIVYAGTALRPQVTPSDTLTLTIINNSVNSATTVITIYYSPTS